MSIEEKIQVFKDRYIPYMVSHIGSTSETHIEIDMVTPPLVKGCRARVNEFAEPVVRRFSPNSTRQLMPFEEFIERRPYVQSFVIYPYEVCEGVSITGAYEQYGQIHKEYSYATPL